MFLMVEGPGCTANGQRARKYVGRRVERVDANHENRLALDDAALLRYLVAVLTLGKELWLVFAHEVLGTSSSIARKTAMRIHFGMSGSMLADGLKPRFGGKVLTLCLHFCGGSSLCFFEVSATALLTPKCVEAMLAKQASGLRRDVCAAEFDISVVAAALAGKPLLLVADAILDQTLLPGAGNIIKNEALHYARVAPIRRVSSLCADEVCRVVEEVRNYSLRWLHSGRAPTPHVYNRTSCLDCNGPVMLRKLGESGLQRPTFWCPRCSESRPSVAFGPGQGSTSHDRASNAISGLVPTPAPSARGQQIILIGNDGTVSSGQASTSHGMASKAISGLASTPAPSASVQQIILIGSDGTASSGQATTSNGRTSEASSRLASPLVPGATVQEMIVSGRKRPLDVELAYAPAPLRRSSQAFANALQSTPVPNAPGLPTCCRKHVGAKPTLKRVRKSGPNTGRLFFGCSARGCNYFEWADTHFPRCRCTPQRLSILRVSKTERSGGRWFFGCIAGSPGAVGNAEVSRCDFFAWTTPHQLSAFGELLTPLL